MSRIGKKPIIIPQGVEVKIDGQKITVKGPKGEINRTLPEKIKASLDKDKLLVLPLEKEKKATAMWGLWRALIANMIEGANHGFEKRLELEGVGYRAEVKGDRLALSVGFSHLIEIDKPPGIEFKLEKNVIIISGVDKQLVGQVAAHIRAKRKPEPYKGTGIKYEGEVIRRKAGKKAVTTELEK